MSKTAWIASAVASIVLPGLIGVALYVAPDPGDQSPATRGAPDGLTGAYWPDRTEEERAAPGEGTLAYVSSPFPDYQAGQEPVTTTLDLTNLSGVPVPIDRLRYVGSQGITIQHDCPSILDGQASCVVTVTAASMIPGVKTGTLYAATPFGLFEEDIVFRAEAAPPMETPDSLPTVTVPPPTATSQERREAVLEPVDPEAMRRAYAVARLAERAARGPAFDFGQDPSAPPVAPVVYRMEDPDYSRENTPSATTSFPVDRTQILTMDRMVWGVLDREINSQLPGLLIVRIDEPVYGTDGLHRLLERGDALLGKYVPLNELGDTRLNVCFFRIIRLADGAHVYDSQDDCFAYATDAMGRTGLVGEVDNRNWEKFGVAAISAAITAAAQYGANATADSDPDLEAAGDSLNDQLGEITTRILEDQIDLAPVITVAAGERVGVQFLRDVYIRRPELIAEGADE